MSTMRDAVGRFDIEDWLAVIGVAAGTAGCALFGLAYGLIFLGLACLGLLLLNVWRAGR